MKPPGGGSIRQVASGHRTPLRVVSHGKGASQKVAKSSATDYSLFGSRAIEWKSWVAESARQTLFMQPCAGEE
jgi:hypothetical protein